MAYKAILGLSELVVGVFLLLPGFDPQATLARLAAEELREDPGDHLVALVSRHLPSLLHHRGLVAVGLVVALLVPFDVRQAVAFPTPGHALLAAANAAVLVLLVLLLGWLPVSRR